MYPRPDLACTRRTRELCAVPSPGIAHTDTHISPISDAPTYIHYSRKRGNIVRTHAIGANLRATQIGTHCSAEPGLELLLIISHFKVRFEARLSRPNRDSWHLRHACKHSGILLASAARENMILFTIVIVCPCTTAASKW